jgi:hypothetical protein
LHSPDCSWLGQANSHVRRCARVVCVRARRGQQQLDLQVCESARVRN